MNKTMMTLAVILLSGSLYTAAAQNRQPAMGCKPVSSRPSSSQTTKPSPAPEKPAAQGYIKDKPSNVNQDKQLKELEKSGH